MVTSVTDPRSKTTIFEYDSARNLTAVETPLGHRETFAYHRSGQLTSRVDPGGNVTGANPNDYTSTFSYGAGDNLLTVMNRSGRSPAGHTTTPTSSLRSRTGRTASPVRGTC